jgi:hypothetical protein
VAWPAQDVEGQEDGRVGRAERNNPAIVAIRQRGIGVFPIFQLFLVFLQKDCCLV